MQRIHHCTYVAAGLEPETFGFQTQVANHKATRPNIEIFAFINFEIYFCDEKQRVEIFSSLKFPV